MDAGAAYDCTGAAYAGIAGDAGAGTDTEAVVAGTDAEPVATGADADAEVAYWVVAGAAYVAVGAT